MNSAQEAAVRRFPSAAGRIADLMNGSEDFRSICDDLAAAEHALAEVDSLIACPSRFATLVAPRRKSGSGI
jgi:hypothetical protein